MSKQSQIRQARRMSQRQTRTTACRWCGACCRRLIIEANHDDVRREPRIATECVLLDGHGSIPFAEAAWSVAVGQTRRCPFLRDGNRCTIYATRPTECRAFRPGSAKCRMVRAEDAALVAEAAKEEKP